MRKISLSNQVLDNHVPAEQFVRRNKPRWLRMQLPQSQSYYELANLINEHQLHTVCQEAACPNMGECWSHGVATVMILGDTCTRSCGFCNIKTGKPPTLDTEEPQRVAEAVRIMNLNYVVITSVNRDELPDGGATIWAQTIEAIRQASPKTQIEVLTPDFCGDWDALQIVLNAKPDVFNHNVETIERLHRAVRPQAKYLRSLEVLRRAKAQGFITKTSLMVGLGETDEEVQHLMIDVHQRTQTDQGSCDILTIGQYLQPSANHLPVHRFVHPDQFAAYKTYGESMGWSHVESGPMVRSSYHADRQAAAASQLNQSNVN